ncbi:hypothetical protein DVH24_029348 [Malus domestica]|uniref:Histidine-containing phosphotransfer protein n=1 Tax=Malus domestica TaxID=3750 RepID=A0A498HYG9_MALDO|nr:hypothetical protein DVH24_029348 [Malus domestica]
MSAEIKKMEGNSLREQVAAMRQSLFDEEILDKQFVQMEELEDVHNPNFAEELMTLYFRDSSKLLVSVEKALERPPYDANKLDKFLHQLKGSSASVGANKVWIETNKMREALKAEDVERIKNQFQLVKRAHKTLKGKLEPYFHLLRQAGPADAAQPPE